MNITQKVQKWGNGTGVRLPKKVMQAARLEADQTVEITLQGESIVLTPVQPTTVVTLGDLLKGVTPEKVGGEMDWGADTGSERYE